MKAMFETNNGERIITHMDEAGKLHIEITTEAEVNNYVIDTDESWNFISHVKKLKERHLNLIDSNRSFRQKLIRSITPPDETI